MRYAWWWMVGLAAACSSASSGTQQPGDPGVKEPPPILVTAAPAAETFGPAGGTLVHSSGARILVPPGALAAPTRLTLTGIAPSSALGGTPLGQAFEAGPEGQHFLKPIEVILPFDPARVPAGADAMQAQIYTAPQSSTAFVALQSSVDLAARLVRTTTVHFSHFVPVQNANPIVISTPETLREGTVGAAYSQAFAASGGTAPYAWSVEKEALPAGLSFTGGTLSGTPSAPALFAFFVKASDGAGHAVQRAFSLTVNPALHPVPALTAIDPSTGAQGSTATITLSGTGFVPSSLVRWDGTPIPTTFVSPTQLSASVALTATGTHQLSVFSPVPGGGTSAAVAFTVTPAVPSNPIPTISSVSPTFIPASGTATQIAIVGTNFSALTAATIGTTQISTSYVSPTSLDATIPASYLAGPGTLQIGVFNPTPGGGFSPSLVDLTVGALNPVPTLTTISPTSVNAGSASFTLAVVGAQFATGGQLFFNTTALATTVTGAANAFATVPASLVTTAGSATVTFVNPTPGGGTSGGVTLLVAAPPADGGSGDAGGCGPINVAAICGARYDERSVGTTLDITSATLFTMRVGRNVVDRTGGPGYLRGGCDGSGATLASATYGHTGAAVLQPGQYAYVNCLPTPGSATIRETVPPQNTNTSCATASTNLTAAYRVQSPGTTLYFQVTGKPADLPWSKRVMIGSTDQMYEAQSGYMRVRVQKVCGSDASTIFDQTGTFNHVGGDCPRVGGGSGDGCLWYNGATDGISEAHPELTDETPYWIVLSDIDPGVRPRIVEDLSSH